MREVAAAEKCGTNTVTKVTNSLEGQEEMRRLGQEHTERLRDQFRAIAEKGLKTLAEAVETDPKLLLSNSLKARRRRPRCQRAYPPPARVPAQDSCRRRCRG